MNNTDPNEQNNVEFYTDDDLILRLLREFEKEKADFFEEAIKTNRPYIANPLELMNGFHGYTDKFKKPDGISILH